MILDNKFRNIFFYTWIIFTLLSFMILSGKFFSSDIRKDIQWDKYYTIITSDSELIEDLFEDNGIENYISYNKSSISYNGISCMKRIPLDEITRRFDSSDPRFDPYMKKIGTLFFAEDGDVEYSLLYLEKKSISIYKLYFQMFRKFYGKNISWNISGFNPFKIFLPALLFLIHLILLVIIDRRGIGRFKHLIGSLNWFPFILYFGFPACVAAIVLNILIYRKSFSFFIPIVIILLFSYVIFFQQFSYTFPIYFFFAIICNCSLFFIFRETLVSSEKISKGFHISTSMEELNSMKIPSRKWNHTRIRISKPEHQLFSPVRILTPEKKYSGKIKKVQLPELPGIIHLIPGLIIISMIIVIQFFEKEPGSMIMPVVYEKDNLEWSLENTAFLYNKFESGNVSFISPADYIIHAAYQESFLYGSRWEYPLEEKPVLYPVFSVEDDIVSKNYRSQTEYSNKWFRDKIELLGNNNPAKLLFSTENPSILLRKVNHNMNNSIFVLHTISFSMLLLLLLILSNLKIYSKITFSIRKKNRRNEQVA